MIIEIEKMGSNKPTLCILTNARIYDLMESQECCKGASKL